jgi:hypothetical protein
MMEESHPAVELAPALGQQAAFHRGVLLFLV